MKKLLLLAVACLQLLNFATAQWVSNPTLNTAMFGADTSSHHEIMANPNDSSYYILTFKKIVDPNRNFELYMQKFDFNGNKKWADNGILVSQAPQKEWVSGIDLTYNHDSCIYVAYSRLAFESNTEDTNTYIFMNKITESGNKLWGEEGIQVTSLDDYADYNPKLMVSNDNNILIAHEVAFLDTIYNIVVPSLRLKKFSSNGDELWSYNFPHENHVFNWGLEFICNNDDNIMCLYRHIASEMIGDTAINYNQHIYSQIFNNEGIPLYANPKTLFVFPTYTNMFPLSEINIQADNDGCFYMSTFFQDDYDETQTYVQYFNADLDTLFPHPVEISTYHYSKIERNDHSIAYIPGSDELMVTWIEMNLLTKSNTIYGQAINKQGQRLWGEEGKVLYPTLSTLHDGKYYDASLRTSGDTDAILFFMEYVADEDFVYVYANKFNNNGDTIWSNTVTVSNAPNLKGNFIVTEKIKDQWVAIWDKVGSSIHPKPPIMYGQNILTEGKIGTGINEMYLSSFVINIFPNPASRELNIAHNIKNPNNANVMLSNVLGQNIKTWNISASDMKRNLITLPLENIPNGFYIVSIITDNGAASTKIEVLR